MKLAHCLPEPSAENPFEHCKLGREEYADVLTSLITTYDDGFVLALNNKWGEGKTTFVRMWQKKFKDHKTCYFNAWENDFDHDPLIAILSELKQFGTAINYKKLVKKAATFATVVGRALVEKHVDTAQIVEGAKNLNGHSLSFFQKRLEDFSEKKNSLQDFRNALEEYVHKLEKKPLVFIIDELDRCNPRYAVEVLEKIKHFFSVPGIVFVLSLDKEQLQHSIKGNFGSSEFDAEEYLRRFIDLEFRLPRPAPADYVDYLYNYYGFDDFFRNIQRNKYTELHYENEVFKSLANYLFEEAGLSLRQQEKIFIHARTALRCHGITSHTYPKIFLMLIFLKFHKPEVYLKIAGKKYTLQELTDYSFSSFQQIKSDDISKYNQLLYLEAELIEKYISSSEWTKDDLIDKNTEPHKLKIKPRFALKDDHFLEALSHASNRSSYKSLDQIIKRIELSQQLS